uniref:RNA-directed DNA polymerase n=1 Tax=Homalodisca liturata TaxID=320908 RepID=A0A1B6H681_9HEMI
MSAENKKMSVIGSVNIKIKIDMFTWKVEFVIVKDLAQKAILGANFIKHSGLLIDLKNNCCRFDFNIEKCIKFVQNITVACMNTNHTYKIGCQEASNEILKIIKEFPTVFTDKIGKTLDYEYKLKVKDHEPVKLRPYPLNPPKQLKIKKIIDELLEQDIIQPSVSQYSSPAFLVGKEDGKSERLVVNYKELNKKLEGVSYPIGDMHELYYHLKGNNYYSVIDLTKSFYQISLAKESQELTTFSVPFGSYSFKRIPFGLLIGSGVLSSYMNKILGELRFTCTLAFLDDIIVYSKTLEEHYMHLKQVLECLKKNNLTVNPEKVKFCYNEIKFLGHLVSKDTIRMDPDRTRTLLESPRPRDKKGIARFIGMTSYFSKFIPNYAEIAHPLNEMRKKSSKFVWDQKCQESFDKLKRAVTRPPVLAIPDFNKEFTVQCDASDKALGSCLLQEADNGHLKPVAYYSRKFNESEVKLTTYQKEALAVVCSINKFRNFLEMRPFNLVTDNSALAWVLSHFRKLGKLGRWVEVILSLPFKITHVKGNQNPVADYLSRLFQDSEVDNNVLHELEKLVNKDKMNDNSLKMNNETVNNKDLVIREETVSINSISTMPFSFMDLKTHQKQDVNITKIMEGVLNYTNSDVYSVEKGVLFYVNNKNNSKRIYLPEHLFKVVYEYYHNSLSGCHFGILKTQQKINERFYHPKLNDYVKNNVKCCEVCLKAKSSNWRDQGPLNSNLSSRPMQKLYMDIYGPLPASSNRMQYILIAVDDFTKYNWIMPLRKCTSGNVINALENNIFKNFSLPEEFVTDNGTYFVSEEFKNYLFNLGIKQRTIIPYTPQGNKSERQIRNLNQILTAYYHDCKKNWDKDLYHVQMALNTCHNESIKSSAFELMFSFKANDGLSLKWQIKDICDEKWSKDKNAKMVEAIQNLKRQNELNSRRNRYNRNHRQLKMYDVVYCRITNQRYKLDLKYEGPFRIISIISSNSYVVQNLKELNEFRRIHLQDVKPTGERRMYI